MPEQVRIVPLLPDEHEMSRGHEIGDERATGRGTRERVGADAVPAGVITAFVFTPELLVLREQLVRENHGARLEAFRIHVGRIRKSCQAPGAGVRGLSCGSAQRQDWAASTDGYPGGAEGCRPSVTVTVSFFVPR